MISLTVNGKQRTYSGDGSMPLLWYLRDELKLKGTKYGCGISECGACTVHLNGGAARSCVVTMESVEGAKVTTIEGLASGEALHPIQQSWVDEDVPQCGYCQVGWIMAVAAFLKDVPNPSDEDVDKSLTNLCRCGTYTRIRKAVHRAAAALREKG